ncbi:hypothetical protein PoB_003164900 [Plakobranchus ocellatus]|uniref:Uncharacterized protein n=1 Tax=Plakobranchus ocellatus TaxID=259542 RepID=A0AAV4AFW2_9GAST|nr:hypothetical protein PoB_003164900 [Plakobranchus ocellatus]
MLMSDSHYCRAVTTSTSRIHPSPHTGRTSRQTRRPHCGGGPLNYSQHRRATSPLTTRTVRWVDSTSDSTWEEKEVEDSRRRSRRDDSARKEVGIEDQKAKWRKRCHLVLNERQSIGDNLPWSPPTTRGSHGGANSSPGPTRGLILRRPLSVHYFTTLFFLLLFFSVP